VVICTQILGLRLFGRSVNLDHYSKLKSSFFYKKKEDEMVLTRKEKETLRARSQDTSIVICKPDKGNGVVVLDKRITSKSWVPF